ncbi:conjugal transfer protein TraG N-terminal domain-containing protein [Novosphingobium sp. SL115]|uniref:conjugal transfer protein TraG N-terminal domain-containing protein n=1 Tax=Novosphingobium sp. SL115 TaxID=2995150 RepID=UPI0022750F87|nr:conjugal transfer protein TraG N-terminal domain-containing protein [Novosphingobium sp. SL115]MCY1669605.1 conjugal transfer protein TraG N-terminal domain-containing protein [Novosphingobium sp. SL115]
MLEVFTVGGGEFLVNTFNAVAAWTGSGGFRSLLSVCMVMGLTYALLITAMDLDWRVWLRWFIQSMLIYLVLMVPTVTVKVTDRINAGLAPATVANVPIGLGMMASFTSQISDYFTRTAETVFVMPSALNYSTGGYVYGAKLWDKTRTFEIRDPVFRANLDSFLKQCAYYDILLGTRSLKLLSESSDLWADLGVNAATNRGMKFLTDNGGTTDIEGKTCAQGWQALNAQWNAQVDAAALPFARTLYPKLTAATASGKLAADLPVIAQLLTGSSASRNQILRQKSMIDAFEAAQLDFGNVDSDAFALQRADIQARNAMTTAAEQSLIWIPVLNVVLTVVFYALFPVVFPLLLMPRTGIATLKGYFAGFFYLAAWGPIYVLIHSFVMDRLAAQSRALASSGVTLGNWSGITSVNQDVATMAGFLMMSVPVLALMVMRGTLSVAHSMGSMLDAAQGAADAAAAERTTGNYAFGDVSYGNLNSGNVQTSQWNTAPNLTAGAAHSASRGDDGRVNHGYGSGRSVVDTSGAISQLPFKATMTSGYAADLRNQGQWYLNEADRIENGASTTWSSSRGRFGSTVEAASEVSGRRQESGQRISDTNNLTGSVSVEGATGHTSRQVYSNDLILREGNSRSSGTFEQSASGTTANASATASLGVGGGRGGNASIGAQGALFARSEAGHDSRTTHDRSAANQVTKGSSDTDEVSYRTIVSGSSQETRSDGTFDQSSKYGDRSSSSTTSSGNDWRTSEADERREAAARYREIGNRMLTEASYAQSRGFQISDDLSNLIQDRYEALRQDHPEWHLPELSDPNLGYRDLARRDAAVTLAMDDLMSDLRAQRITELSDVKGLAGTGSLGTHDELGGPATLPASLGYRTSPLIIPPVLRSIPVGPDDKVDGARAAAALGISIKPGANLSQLHRDMVPAMTAVAAEARALGLPKPVITSGNDSKQHVDGSRHYQDRALDFRGNRISTEQGNAWARSVQAKLGDDYTVQFEQFPSRPARNHLHVAKR